ncbi:MAG: hypothetical protein ACRDSL_13960 [Pseudonocardiaceae bacterium]
MTFRRTLSLSLMAADFLALGRHHDAVLVVLGVDEQRDSSPSSASTRPEPRSTWVTRCRC